MAKIGRKIVPLALLLALGSGAVSACGPAGSPSGVLEVPASNPVSGPANFASQGTQELHDLMQTQTAAFFERQGAYVSILDGPSVKGVRADVRVENLENVSGYLVPGHYDTGTGQWVRSGDAFDFDLPGSFDVEIYSGGSALEVATKMNEVQTGPEGILLTRDATYYVDKAGDWYKMGLNRGLQAEWRQMLPQAEIFTDLGNAAYDARYVSRVARGLDTARDVVDGAVDLNRIRNGVMPGPDAADLVLGAIFTGLISDMNIANRDVITFYQNKHPDASVGAGNQALLDIYNQACQAYSLKSAVNFVGEPDCGPADIFLRYSAISDQNMVTPDNWNTYRANVLADSPGDVIGLWDMIQASNGFIQADLALNTYTFYAGLKARLEGDGVYGALPAETRASIEGTLNAASNYLDALGCTPESLSQGIPCLVETQRVQQRAMNTMKGGQYASPLAYPIAPGQFSMHLETSAGRSGYSPLPVIDMRTMFSSP